MSNAKAKYALKFYSNFIYQAEHVAYQSTFWL